ncbi:hypothetical protein EAH84_06580 [Sphingomonas oligophenolica]|uniref:Uncharacterized protein n=2 Tax=Sphingomonas oligophenolica TaxID=301154 RepID=A0A502CH81_9SPHN|nr:hypothetical protein EAH84_06580 [Sphingomonas oligophenolica]
MFKTVMGAVAALSMIAVPTMASAATNPAAPLSVSSSVRSGTAASHKNGIAGGSGVVIALGIVAGIIAIGVIAATKNDNVNTPVSR